MRKIAERTRLRAPTSTQCRPGDGGNVSRLMAGRIPARDLRRTCGGSHPLAVKTQRLTLWNHHLSEEIGNGRPGIPPGGPAADPPRECSYEPLCDDLPIPEPMFGQPGPRGRSVPRGVLPRPDSAWFRLTHSATAGILPAHVGFPRIFAPGSVIAPVACPIWRPRVGAPSFQFPFRFVWGGPHPPLVSSRSSVLGGQVPRRRRRAVSSLRRTR